MMRRILIVEDEFIIAENLRQVLKGLGYDSVEHAFDGDEAIAMLKQEKFDLALLDVSLSGKLDGIEVGQWINTNLGIPFIFLTSLSDKQTISRAVKIQAAGFLSKPFIPANIYAAIEIAFAKNDASLPEVIYLKTGGAIKKVLVDDVDFFKADRVYVEVHLKGSTPVLVRESLSSWEEKLPHYFMRVNRSYIVNLQHVESVETTFLVIAGIKIALPRNLKDEILSRLEN